MKDRERGLDTETIANRGIAESNSQSTGGQGSRVCEDEVRCSSLKQTVRKLWSFDSLPLGE